MARLVTLGTLSALFFSSTFVLNRSAVKILRAVTGRGLPVALWLYADLSDIHLASHSRQESAARGQGSFCPALVVLDDQRQHWLWHFLFHDHLQDSIYAEGWIVATTWQTTILATPIVLSFFGRKVPIRGLIFTGIIFIGIVLVNVEHASDTDLRGMLLSALPVLVAAFAYPIGNQLVWEARMGDNKRIPHIEHPILENAFARVLLFKLLARSRFGGFSSFYIPSRPLQWTVSQHSVGRSAFRCDRHDDLSLRSKSFKARLRDLRSGCNSIHGSRFLTHRRDTIPGRRAARSDRFDRRCSDHAWVDRLHGSSSPLVGIIAQ